MEVVYLPQVEKFVRKLEPRLAYRVMRSIDFIQQHGSLLGMPISKSLGRGLFELRIVGNNHIRMFYCFHNHKAYLLHAITKKQQSIPKHDLDLARKAFKWVVAQ